MVREARIAAVSLVLLLPALLLVLSGLLGLQQPIALVHPLLVMGGLILAFALNALPIVRIRVDHEDGALVGAVSLRLRGSGLNLIALSLSCLLFATITVYLFAENFRLR